MTHYLDEITTVAREVRQSLVAHVAAGPPDASHQRAMTERRSDPSAAAAS